MDDNADADEEAFVPATFRWLSEFNDAEASIAACEDLDELEFCLGACRRAIALPGGVDALYHAAWKHPKLKGTTAVLAALLAARRGTHVEAMYDVAHLPG